MPLHHGYDPRKKEVDATGSLGHGGGSSGQNSGDSPAELVEERLGRVKGLTTVGFVAGVAAEK
jgi:hypothetical protein